MHTDPSLISVVIHDSDDENDKNEYNTTPSNERSGALGLQYYHPREKQWMEPEAHGHSVATIFVGSVFAYLTAGHFPAAKHRVVEKIDCNRQHNRRPRKQQEQQQSEFQLRKQRMAATLFVRPQPSALLQTPLPSPWLLQQIEEKEKQHQQKQQKEEVCKNESNINANANNRDKNSSKIISSKKKKPSSPKPPITFDAWLKRVAKNYEKQKKKRNNKTKV